MDQAVKTWGGAFGAALVVTLVWYALGTYVFNEIAFNPRDVYLAVFINYFLGYMSGAKRE